MNDTTTDTQRNTGWALPVITVIGVVVAIVAAFFGSGALTGTPIDEASGGALSADATPLAPGGPAFRIWSVIYVGLIGYAFWQLTATARRSTRSQRLRPWAWMSILLNAVWIWMVQLDQLLASVAVIIVLLLVLGRIMAILAQPRSGIVELLVTDATFGLYFGWVLVAAFANVWAWCVQAGIDAFTGIPVAVAGIVGAAAIVILVALGGRIAPSLAASWGLVWIAVGRTEGQYESPVLLWTAVVSAVVLMVFTLVRKARTVAD